MFFSNRSKEILPINLEGPRSFFTDLDPKDPNFDETDVIRKLKIQFLTKEKIVIAASSLFDSVGYSIFSSDLGLKKSLEEGVVLPAIRNTFDGISDFFDQKSYCLNSKRFFDDSALSFVSWDLKTNASWFKEKVYSSILNQGSLLRSKLIFSEPDAIELVDRLEGEINRTQSSFLTREQILSVLKKYDKKTALLINNYVNLIYRISGSRVVNAEAHFPQSNLTKIGIGDSDKLLSDESIFWDYYVEGVISSINSVAKFSIEQLDRLSFSQILDIRKSLFDIDFSNEYDKLISKVKSEFNFIDPEKILMRHGEIITAADKLKNNFKDRIQSEIMASCNAENENSLWQVANLTAMISAPQVALVVGCLSALKSIPEITAYVSKPLAEDMDKRISWMRDYLNTKVGWSNQQKKILLDGYKELLTAGI